MPSAECHAIAGRPAEIDRFLGVMTGSVPMEELFSGWSIAQLVGIGGMPKIGLTRARARSSSTAAVA